jgi:hypothetical protein
MPFEPKDILLALKHIALSEQLNGAEKQFAAFLVDSFNRKTGRCDPSEETAAFLLGKSSRTIVRAGNRLAQLKLFVRRKHAGHNHCNSYLPNWQLFRENEDRYKTGRREHANRFNRQKLSPSECQPRHLHTDNTVIQTSPSNNIPSTYPIVAAAIDCSSQQIAEAEKRLLINKARTPIGARDPFSPYLNLRSSRQAADSAAERSWHNALIDRFGTGPIYAVIVEEMDAALQDVATKAELKRRGAGIISILEEMVRRGIRLT